MILGKRKLAEKKEENKKISQEVSIENKMKVEFDANKPDRI
jgi:hypothetical protein